MRTRDPRRARRLSVPPVDRCAEFPRIVSSLRACTLFVSLAFAACSIPDTRFHASPGDSSVDVMAVDATTCTSGETRCSGNNVEECQGGVFVAKQTCDNLCSASGCVTPPSCDQGVAICGNGSETCCRSLPVPGGTFSRSFDNVGFLEDRYHATLTAFHLDKYEVNVARFRKFLDAYPASKPAVGAGKNPRDLGDPGWKSEWTALLPAGQGELQTMLTSCGVSQTQAQIPVRCLTWYAAQAFCVWDGGRLPTEAEWNYAASGGDQQRVYPWSAPPTSTMIAPTFASYAANPPIVPGSKPDGDGRFGQSDLAGNIGEWVFDNYVSPYPTDTCADCANHTAAARRGVRGGSFASTTTELFSSFRYPGMPEFGDEYIGFRCARDPG